jgi:uncharacterized membrane protein
MAFKKYTQCYVHTAGDKPFNEADLAGLAIVHGVLPGALFGALTGLAVGFLAGGPIGALIGIFAGLTVGVALALTDASQKWRFHRLVCVGGLKCAVGIVRRQPEQSELGAFDNDQFFDLQLMPHPTGKYLGKFPVNGEQRDRFEYDYLEESDNYKAIPPTPGVVTGSDAKADIANHPKNDLLIDDPLQGSELVRPTISDLPYDTSYSWLHCEAEGDFWVRVSDLATALGALIAVLAIATGAAAYAGAAAGASWGCTIGGIFGPIGCLIGAILGAILGGLLAGGAAAAISYEIVRAILQAIFDTDPGDVEDANIGDGELGPISEGDRVLVFGEHVYDGFHQGWHEIHPLMAVVKLADKKMNQESSSYLEWAPRFNDADPLPKDDIPGMPSSSADDITKLSPDDMRQGLNSPKFARRAKWLRERWCGLMHEVFDGSVRTAQQGLTNRWTIHPAVDGCEPAGDRPIDIR